MDLPRRLPYQGVPEDSRLKRPAGGGGRSGRASCRGPRHYPRMQTTPLISNLESSFDGHAVVTVTSECSRMFEKEIHSVREGKDLLVQGEDLDELLVEGLGAFGQAAHEEEQRRVCEERVRVRLPPSCLLHSIFS